MRTLPFASLMVLLFLRSLVLAQKCPIITVEAPDKTDEITVLARAQLKGIGSDANQKFQWTISAGKIVSGQGTNQIAIDTTN